MLTTSRSDLRASSTPINREYNHQHKYSIPRRKAIRPLMFSPVSHLQDLGFNSFYQALPGTAPKGAIYRQNYANAKAMRDIVISGGSKDRLRYRRGGKGEHKDKLGETGQFQRRRVEARNLEHELIPENFADERWLHSMVDNEVDYELEQFWGEDEMDKLEIGEAEYAGVVDRALGVWGERVRKGVEVEGWSFVGEEVVVDESGRAEDEWDEELEVVVL